MKIRRRNHPVEPRKSAHGTNVNGSRWHYGDMLYTHGGAVIERKASPVNPNKTPHVVGHVW